MDNDMVTVDARVITEINALLAKHANTSVAQLTEEITIPVFELGKCFYRVRDGQVEFRASRLAPWRESGMMAEVDPETRTIDLKTVHSYLGTNNNFTNILAFLLELKHQGLIAGVELL